MTMMTPSNTSAKRITVQIPTASGDMIEAWVYMPEGSGPHPAVVMAHGIGAIKAGGLAPFAERFSEEGFVAIAFDYRSFGGSGGSSIGPSSARGLQHRYQLGSRADLHRLASGHSLGHVIRGHACG